MKRKETLLVISVVVLILSSSSVKAEDTPLNMLGVIEIMKKHGATKVVSDLQIPITQVQGDWTKKTGWFYQEKTGHLYINIKKGYAVFVYHENHTLNQMKKALKEIEKKGGLIIHQTREKKF